MEARPNHPTTNKLNKWAMTQEWENILFLHWPVPEQLLKYHVPKELELDRFNGSAWLSLVLFKVKGTRPRFLPPIPLINSYVELNVRTYVKYKNKVGVYFFSLDANKRLVVKLTRIGNFLPYMKARMKYKENKEMFIFGIVRTQVNHLSETLQLTYKPNLERALKKREMDYWLTERYSLWTKPKNNLYRVDIYHPEWKLYPVNAAIKNNYMASFIDSYEADNVPVAHYSFSKKPIFYPPVLEK